ncbi:kinase-like domain-containing protein [Zopfochytrium polystomum]|nr:kinase-like domain-containing protein [Zopfochytrium polystomum]
MNPPHNLVARCDSGFSSPHASPGQPRALPVSISEASLRLLEIADTIADAAFTHQSTVTARRAVRYALRTCPRLDPYSIDRIVGYGANGVVVGGTTLGGAGRAVKIIYKSAHPYHHRDAAAETPREIALMQQLSSTPHAHPGLIAALDAWQDDRHFYVVTELADVDWLAAMFDPSDPPSDDDLLTFFNPRRGLTQTLHASPGSADAWAWLVSRSYERNPAQDLPSAADIRDVVAIFRSAVAAVYHLHVAANTAHGDIKEENVLVVPDPNAAPAGDTCTLKRSPRLTARLCDFGHSVRGSSEPPRLAAYGTARAAPPELRGSASAAADDDNDDDRPPPPPPADGFAADVYALGVLLYALLHGPGRTPGDIDPRVPAGCEEVLRGMTAARPDERWTLPRVLDHPWMRE